MRIGIITIGILLISLASAKATEDTSDLLAATRPSQIFTSPPLEYKEENFRLPSEAVGFPEPSKPWFSWGRKTTNEPEIDAAAAYMFGPNFAKVYQKLVASKAKFHLVYDFLNLKISLASLLDEPCEFTNICRRKGTPYEWIDDLYTELWHQVKNDEEFIRTYPRGFLEETTSSSESHPLLDTSSAKGKTTSPDLDSTDSDEDSEQEVTTASSIKQRTSKTIPSSASAKI